MCMVVASECERFRTNVTGSDLKLEFQFVLRENRDTQHLWSPTEALIQCKPGRKVVKRMALVQNEDLTPTIAHHDAKKMN
jgi:hypothetical protein